MNSRLPLSFQWFLLLCILSPLPAVAQDAKSRFSAGASAVDISPVEFPINMPGNFSEKICTEVHDPFHSRALVISDGATSLAMVVVDNLGIPPEVLDEAKQIALDKTGIPMDRMLVSATHTHTGPPSNAKTGRPGEVAYRQRLIDGIAESIVQAHQMLEPASFGAASHPLPDELFNRRWYLKPGKMQPNPFGEMDQVKMNPPRRAGVLDRPAGPIDPDVTVISIQNAKRRPLALFANYGLHYVGAVPRGQLSADYFGEFARLIPTRLRGGADFVAMMSNGTSGDINNIPFGGIRPPREPFEQIRIVARKAADAAWNANEKISAFESEVTLGMRERRISLRHRDISVQQIEKAKQVLELTDEKQVAALPRYAQVYAQRLLDLSELGDTVTVTLQALRIGDFAVCGIPFETFAEIGLEIKDLSPFSQTMVIGLANGRYGYLPTPAQHRLGGYETWIGTNKVQKDASEIITKNLLEMLAELKEDAS